MRRLRRIYLGTPIMRPAMKTLPVLLMLAFAATPVNAEESTRSGRIEYRPPVSEQSVPEIFRLPAHAFDFDQRPLKTVSTKIAISEVTFPSPVVTPHENNNTVHCEYFRPVTHGKRTAVVVLHILGGDFELSRLFCRTLAHHDVGALFVKMPYYGPRQQPGIDRRMVSRNPRETVAGMTQAVLDIRRAAAWLADQEDVDAQRLGIFGISLGGITSALAASAEPRFQNVCLMLAGGDMGRIGWDSPELADSRQNWLDAGGTRESFFEIVRPIDPVTYASNLHGRRILMLNARHDETIPRACTEALWHALNEPEIIWMDAGHISSMRFIFDGLASVTRFFSDSAPGGKNSGELPQAK